MDHHVRAPGLTREVVVLASEHVTVQPQADLHGLLESLILARSYITPFFSNAATAVLPSSSAFFTSRSPRTFSSARVKTSVAASAGTTQTPSISPNTMSPGRTRTHPISTGIRKSNTL